ncbi:MAG: hypothetical protein KGL13_05330 [Gammaproteobacteria bacterium]|nr:hypothetical protein [Gammaproteobacteria bacterium]
MHDRQIAGRRVFMNRSRLTPLERGLAAGLAGVFLLAGAFALLAGAARHRWIIAVVAIAAIWWGSVWARVAYKGRKLGAGELFWPFRRG